MIDFDRTQTSGSGFVNQLGFCSGEDAVVDLNLVNRASHAAIKRLTRPTDHERFTIQVTDVEVRRLCPLEHTIHVEFYVVSIVGADEVIVLPGRDYRGGNSGGPEINGWIR